uniref:Uncharacterized protein n=1 Tax=Picea glauca TaxID=3330 RepID=A0A101M0C5_PICGL|nr:hypothetical protein ABT39_MTgene4700 [Picea glauca]QHR90953.1 hypothetical protein Q903MT_gene4982 [Picea sitchensis]
MLALLLERLQLAHSSLTLILALKLGIDLLLVAME